MDQKDGPLDGRKLTKIIKTAKRGKSHQKKYLKKKGHHLVMVGWLLVFGSSQYLLLNPSCLKK